MEKPNVRIRSTTREIDSAARRLRQRLTPAEERLWKALQQKRLCNLKFRCQHPIGKFIVDFCCPQHRLVIELDGEIHNQQIEYDQERSHQLNHYGYRVLRFRNEEVMQNLDGVLLQIANAVLSKDPHSKEP